MRGEVFRAVGWARALGEWRCCLLPSWIGPKAAAVNLGGFMPPLKEFFDANPSDFIGI